VTKEFKNLQGKRDRMKQKQGFFVKMSKENSAALRESLEEALRMEKAKKTRDISKRSCSV
jgi:hypothetical protein